MAYVMSARVLDGLAYRMCCSMACGMWSGWAQIMSYWGVVGVGVEQSAEKVGCGLISGG